jgi:hypothetical protein
MLLKYITRIFYAVLAALGLLLVFFISDARARRSYLAETGRVALEEERFEAFLPGGYHLETPALDTSVRIDFGTFRLVVYEVGYFTDVTPGAEHATQGYVFLLYQSEGDPLKDYFDVAIDGDTSEDVFYLGYRGGSLYQTEGDPLKEYFDVPIDGDVTEDVFYLGYRVDPLALYSVFDQDTGGPIVYPSDFKDDTMISAMTFNRTVTAPGAISESDPLERIVVDLSFDTMTIKDKLEAEASARGSAPESDFGDVKVIPRTVIDTSRAVVTGISIYVVAIGAVTYIIFLRSRKTLGRKQPTEGVMQDIAALKEKTSEDTQNNKD